MRPSLATLILGVRFHKQPQTVDAIGPSRVSVAG
jgi:hypothetical protein